MSLEIIIAVVTFVITLIGIVLKYGADKQDTKTRLRFLEKEMDRNFNQHEKDFYPLENRVVKIETQLEERANVKSAD